MVARQQVLRLVFTGDVMLGRLVDQTLPHHVHDVEHLHYGVMLKQRLGLPVDTAAASAEQVAAMFVRPWGDTLPLLQEADLRLINLETAVTAHDVPYPGKAFNFRMHPRNIPTLTAAAVDYASLANNHSLDFHLTGLTDTLAALGKAGIAHAGAGLSAEDAWRPALLERSGVKLLIYSFTDHGCGAADGSGNDLWAAGAHRPGVNYVRLRSGDAAALDAEITRINARIARERHELGAHCVVVSVHWGPNYAWEPSPEIQRFARALTEADSGAVDIIHGHSAHHVQGVELRPNGRVIMYGCGDFVDDYAIDDYYRNDLAAAYVLDLQLPDGKLQEVTPLRLFCVPTRVKDFAVRLLQPSEAEYAKVRKRMAALSSAFNTRALTAPMPEEAPPTAALMFSLAASGSSSAEL